MPSFVVFEDQRFDERPPKGGWFALAQQRLTHSWRSGLFARVLALGLGIPFAYNLIALVLLHEAFVPWQSCLVPAGAALGLVMVGLLPAQRRVRATEKGLRIDTHFRSWSALEGWFVDDVEGGADVTVIARDGVQARLQVPAGHLADLTARLRHCLGEPMAARPEAPVFLVSTRWVLAVSTWGALVGFGCGVIAIGLSLHGPVLGRLFPLSAMALGGGAPAVTAWWPWPAPQWQRRGWALLAFVLGASVAMLLAVLGASYALAEG
ncbi:MAG: hypothetical protein QM765_32905 [Myxococcales bacterium]